MRIREEPGMPCPDVSVEQVAQLIPQARDIKELDQGGQKRVFTGILDARKYALKFLGPNLEQFGEEEGPYVEAVTARAQREVATMQQCETPHLVRMGPIGLEVAQLGGQTVIYFSEEFVDGKDLKQYLSEDGALAPQEIVRLAMNVSEAVEAIWQFSKIHRDIKPKNIMKKRSNGDYVLLDMGLVFDLEDDSLSVSPVGTPLYFSPEQMDFTNRRTSLNFRSDLFSLGIVMYEMATGQHPFLPGATTTLEVMANIQSLMPRKPIEIRPEIGQGLSDVIMRLMAKRPALRYRSIKLFQRALAEIAERG